MHNELDTIDKQSSFLHVRFSFCCSLSRLLSFGSSTFFSRPFRSIYGVSGYVMTHFHSQQFCLVCARRASDLAKQRQIQMATATQSHNV